MATDEIMPGERRELRSVVRGQFKVLRAEVDRRKEELQSEIEAALLEQYRAQDEAIAEAKKEVSRATSDFIRQIEEIGDRLKELRPELVVDAGETHGRIGLNASDPNRTQERRTAIASIPGRIGDAKLNLDRTEMDILRELSAGALKTEQARDFLGQIPTVGELIPRVVMRQLERNLKEPS